MRTPDAETIRRVGARPRSGAGCDRDPGRGLSVDGLGARALGCPHVADGALSTSGPGRGVEQPQLTHLIGGEHQGFTIGLKGTGSKTIVVDDVFIPDERAVSSEDMPAGTSPGARFHPNAQYSAASVCIFTPPLAGTAMGAARGFLHAFEQRMRSRLAVADAQQAGEQAAVLMPRSTSSTEPGVGAIRRTRRRWRGRPSTACLNQAVRAHSSIPQTCNVCGETRTRRQLITG